MAEGIIRKNWSDDELKVAIEVYLREDLNETQKEQLLSEYTGRKSVGFRLGNVKYLAEGEGGFPNGGENLKRVWAQYMEDKAGFIEEAKMIEESGLLKMMSGTDAEELDLMKRHPGSYRLVMAKQRKYQDELRKNVLRCAENRCCLTGINQISLLRTSHIMDWSECTDDEKTDPHNALCLNAFHDNLFDSYHMTIDMNMNVIYDPKLKQTLPEEIYKSMIEPYKTIVVKDCNRPLKKYIEFHNKKFKETTGLSV